MKSNMVLCPICESEVTKRSTLMVNGRRICRKHEESTKYLDELESEAQVLRAARQLDASMDKIFEDELVRALRDIRAIDSFRYVLAMTNLGRNKGYSYEEKIRAKVEAKEVTPEEASQNISSGISTWLHLQQESRNAT